jgi:Zn2+/Cd2+-exporting ATPase
VAADVEVDEVRAELPPSGKADAVAELRSRYGHVAMVGDGVNDAQAMASSTLGIALGGSGVDVVMETADVVLVSGGLKKLPFLLRHARRTLAIIKQNIAIAIALKAALLVLRLGHALDGHRRRHGRDAAGDLQRPAATARKGCTAEREG